MPGSVLKSGGSRRFGWISSSKGDPSELERLHHDLQVFYSGSERDPYQAMLDRQDEEDLRKDTPAKYAVDHVRDLEPGRVLEVGCSSGRAYRALKERAFSGTYAGCDVAEPVIARNRDAHPEATWVTCGAYRLPFGDGSFDVCFSMYVLEHLVYPEAALNEMLRVTREDGSVVLLFPDFRASGRLASQQGGLSFGTTSEKLRQGKLLDAMVTFYDYRVRLPRALKRLETKSGDFVVQTQPACLRYPHMARPDYDAVYIASKAEIIDWAEGWGYEATLPEGEQGMFKEHALVVVRKTERQARSS